MNTKRNLTVIVVFLLINTILWSQQTTIDTTYRPKTYDVQVRQFKSYPDNTSDIIFLGNSITARAQWNELLQIKEARNRGVSGDTTFGILERLLEIMEGQPSRIFLLIGINDISRSFPDDIILENHENIIARIKKESPNTRVYIRSIKPIHL